MNDKKPEETPLPTDDSAAADNIIETTDESADILEQHGAEESPEADSADIEVTEAAQETEHADDAHADNDVADDISSTADEAVIQQQQGKKQSASRLLLILPLLVAALLGGLAVSGQLQPLYHSLTGWVTALSGRSPASPPPAKWATAEQAQQLLEKVDSMHADLGRVAEAQKQLPPQTDNIADALHAELGEVASALNTLRNDSIAKLSSQLNQMAEAQHTLQTSLQEQQKINLQMRLRWITDPASRLPQIKLAWEEIALLAGLSDEQRARAEEMHTLARNNIQQLRQWQGSIRTWANRLAPPLHRNILPKFDQPWLDWAIGQFHLRPAPSAEARKMSRLRMELEQIANGLTTEIWPTESDWQRLRAQLVLQARSHRDRENTEPIALNLPDSFEAIKTDINTLQQTAQQWLEQS